MGKKNEQFEDLEIESSDPAPEPTPEPEFPAEGEPEPEPEPEIPSEKVEPAPQPPEEIAEPTEVTEPEPPTEQETAELKERLEDDSTDPNIGLSVRQTKATVQIVNTIATLRALIRETGPGRSTDVALIRLDEVEQWARDASRPE